MHCCPLSTSFGRCFSLLLVIGAIGIVAGGFTQTAEKPAPAAVKSQPYPLDTCVVSGQKLDANGGAVTKDIDGRQIKFCCNRCAGKFDADKATYIKKLDDEIIAQQIKHYPLTTCVVMEEDSLEDESKTVNYVYANRLVRFCCKGCIKDFTADPAKFLAKIDEAVIKQQKDAYPLTTCPVSGEKLGGMGEPVMKVYGVTLVKFCCMGCVSRFEGDYAANMAKVTNAWKAKHADSKKGDDHSHDGHQH